ncbi:2-dehydro-3-deoxygalactonokinase [Kocuria sp. M1R5S2]|uniref:2-dehydro-3-deoxygalactonokinase n=1 Tax=Kocuria rhizosphaerae TaxID=3376285 RepID=UPI003795C355
MSHLPTDYPARHDPRLIALDWGTSSARAYLLDALGTVLDDAPWGRGILEVTAQAITAQERRAAFEEEFERMCGRWLDEYPEAVALASGMVGSNQGWADVPYQHLPQDLTSLADALTEVPTRRGPVHIVPGLLSDGPLPQVMRGEETQILGVLELAVDPENLDARAERVVALPGTHTKWVRLRGSEVTDFLTVMTGEIYGLLTQHSILARLARRPETPDMEAFDRGVQTSLNADPDAGILSTLFLARTLPLTRRLAAEQVDDYISGLMIGAEVASCVRGWLPSSPDHSPGSDRPEVLLCGEPQLCGRYQRVLRTLDVDAAIVAGDVVTRGLRRIALSAGLLDRPGKGME